MHFSKTILTSHLYEKIMWQNFLSQFHGNAGIIFLASITTLSISMKLLYDRKSFSQFIRKKMIKKAWVCAQFQQLLYWLGFVIVTLCIVKHYVEPDLFRLLCVDKSTWYKVECVALARNWTFAKLEYVNDWLRSICHFAP